MSDLTLTLAAGETRDIDITGRYFRVMEATADLFVALDGGALQKRNQGTGEGGDELFSRISVYSPTAQTVLITVGTRRVDDDRLSLSEPVPIAVADNIASDTYALAVASAVELAIPARANRKRLLVLASPNNTAAVRIGDSGISSSGIGPGWGLGPGETMPPLETTAAVYMTSNTVGQRIQYIEEF